MIGTTRAQRILTNCRRVMSDAGRLLLMEPLIPPGNAAACNKLLDLLMPVWNAGGRERTEREHQRLLGAAGFHLSRVIPTRSGLSILEAVPV